MQVYVCSRLNCADYIVSLSTLKSFLVEAEDDEAILQETLLGILKILIKHIDQTTRFLYQCDYKQSLNISTACCYENMQLQCCCLV